MRVITDDFVEAWRGADVSAAVTAAVGAPTTVTDEGFAVDDDGTDWRFACHGGDEWTITREEGCLEITCDVAGGAVGVLWLMWSMDRASHAINDGLGRGCGFK